MKPSKIEHFILWLKDKNKKYRTNEERITKILKQEEFKRN
jgi:hypothetical protein